tara:strand:- start:93 stop:371 length:279 start_codon:yes stop_codon:yes gene_type:complete
MVPDFERCKFVDDCSNPNSICLFGTKLGQMGWMLCAPRDMLTVPSGKYVGYTLTYYSGYSNTAIPNTLASIGAMSLAVSTAALYTSLLGYFD